MRQIVGLLIGLVLLGSILGCGGDRGPVNLDKDRPVPKKDK